jgi:hypothetical protein
MTGIDETFGLRGADSRRGVSRRAFLGRASVAATGLAAGGLVRTASADAALPGAAAYSAEVPAAWFDLALQLVQTTPGFLPPVAARAFGYAGVALHEAIAPGIRPRRSLAGQLNGYTSPGCPADGDHHWPTVANSALASILRSLFATAPQTGIDTIAALEQRFADSARPTLSQGVFRRSVKRGTDIAQHVFDWSRTDGGHEGYLRNFPPYTPPAGPGLWVPTPLAFSSALQPTWGSNRAFVLRSGASCPPDAPLPYSEEPGSPFYADGLETSGVGTTLTAEQEAIARFWSDDPGATATPAGHSISILNQLVAQLGLRLDVAAVAYAKLGIAVSDAFVACWHTKYRYNLIRPVTYIRRVIDPTWTPLLVTPPFPEYTSGHSVQSGAAAEVLTDLFGRVAFTDTTHAPSRSFGSFRAAAQEAALSRLYGGIHFRRAIDGGLEQGRCVGREVNELL